MSVAKRWRDMCAADHQKVETGELTVRGYQERFTARDRVLAGMSRDAKRRLTGR